jgi:hypothetical protein
LCNSVLVHAGASTSDDAGQHVLTIDTVITPEEASAYSQALWELYGPKLAAVVDVDQPPDLHDRFKVFFDGLDLPGVPRIPEWVMDLYAVQNAVTAGYYHQRNVQKIEDEVMRTITEAIEQLPPVARANAAVRTMTLSFEYQAFLFAFRRTFEYLASGLLGAFGLPAPGKISETATDLSNADARYQSWVPAMRAHVGVVARRFANALAYESPRNRTAHSRPVEAGNFRFWLEPGMPVRIGLEEGGEGLPMRMKADVHGEPLAVTLDRQLRSLSDSVFELFALLPHPGEGLEVKRLR